MSCLRNLLICLSLLTASILPSLGAEPTELRIGDSPEKVESVLGKPDGYMAMDTLTIYTYELGTIRFKEDKVSSINLITPEELAVKKQQEAEAVALRTAQGEKIKAAMEADERFAALPAENRAAFWERFRRDYPEVDVYVLYYQAKAEADQIAAAENEKKREQLRIANLELRVQQAEEAARQAQQAAATARIFNQTRYYNSSYPYVVNTSPIIIRKTTHNPQPEYPIYGPGWNVRVNLNGEHSQTTTSGSTLNGYPRGNSYIQGIKIGNSW